MPRKVNQYWCVRDKNGRMFIETLSTERHLSISKKVNDLDMGRLSWPYWYKAHGYLCVKVKLTEIQTW